MAMHKISIMATQTATQEKTMVEEIYAYLRLSPKVLVIATQTISYNFNDI